MLLLLRVWRRDLLRQEQSQGAVLRNFKRRLHRLHFRLGEMNSSILMQNFRFRRMQTAFKDRVQCSLIYKYIFYKPLPGEDTDEEGFHGRGYGVVQHARGAAQTTEQTVFVRCAGRGHLHILLVSIFEWRHGGGGTHPDLFKISGLVSRSYSNPNNSG